MTNFDRVCNLLLLGFVVGDCWRGSLREWAGIGWDWSLKIERGCSSCYVCMIYFIWYFYKFCNYLLWRAQEKSNSIINLVLFQKPPKISSNISKIKSFHFLTYYKHKKYLNSFNSFAHIFYNLDQTHHCMDFKKKYIIRCVVALLALEE